MCNKKHSAVSTQHSAVSDVGFICELGADSAISAVKIFKPKSL